MATNSISIFYHLEQVWNLGIIAKCYCSQVSKIITKVKNFDSISDPKEVKVLIKSWKLQTIFATFNHKEILLDGFKLAAPQECSIHREILNYQFLSTKRPKHHPYMCSFAWKRYIYK